jgi:Flp pilus assembly protein TadG
MRGQALLELALSIPVLLLLSVGTVAVIRVADARSGLDAATAAAAATAARQADAVAAGAAARDRFTQLAAGYPLQSPSLTLDLGAFGRGCSVRATAQAGVDLSWAPFPGLPATISLRAAATATVEPWRSRG